MPAREVGIGAVVVRSTMKVDAGIAPASGSSTESTDASSDSEKRACPVPRDPQLRPPRKAAARRRDVDRTAANSP